MAEVEFSEDNINRIQPGSWVRVDDDPDWKVFFGLGREHSAAKLVLQDVKQFALVILDLNEVSKLTFSEETSMKQEVTKVQTAMDTVDEIFGSGSDDVAPTPGSLQAPEVGAQSMAPRPGR